jgi:hypothetical protein
MPYSKYFEMPAGKFLAKNLNSAGTGAQLLSLAGARKCLNIEKFWFPVDDFLMFNRIVGLRTALLDPQVLSHADAGASDTEKEGYFLKSETVLRKTARLATKVLREFDRISTSWK